MSSKHEQKTFFEEIAGQTFQPAKIGKDEMNLAEFPLALLGKKINPTAKKAIFTEKVFDPISKQDIERRVEISADEGYTLPNSTDDEVLLGLLQLGARENFRSQKVYFSRYELLKYLGWDDSAKSYQRLTESLNKWVGITIRCKNYWFDNDEKQWQSVAFHPIDSVTFYEGRSSKKRDYFIIGEKLYRSTQAGYLRNINMDLFRDLSTPTAKRLYRFLDKHFYRHNRRIFPLREFACEKIGISRNLDTGQIKQALNVGIRELEKVGFLKKLSISDRYKKKAPKVWDVIFIKETGEIQELVAIDDILPIEKQLIDLGVTKQKAAKLIDSYTEEYLRHKVEYLEYEISMGRSPKKTKAGWLISAIEENWQPPEDFKTQAELKLEETKVDAAKTKRDATDFDRKLNDDVIPGLMNLLEREESFLAGDIARSMDLATEETLKSYLNQNKEPEHPDCGDYDLRSESIEAKPGDVSFANIGFSALRTEFFKEKHPEVFAELDLRKIAEESKRFVTTEKKILDAAISIIENGEVGIRDVNCKLV